MSRYHITGPKKYTAGKGPDNSKPQRLAKGVRLTLIGFVLLFVLILFLLPS